MTTETLTSSQVLLTRRHSTPANSRTNLDVPPAHAAALAPARRRLQRKNSSPTIDLNPASAHRCREQLRQALPTPTTQVPPPSAAEQRLSRHISRLMQRSGCTPEIQTHFLANNNTYRQHRVITTHPLSSGYSCHVYPVRDAGGLPTNKIFKCWKYSVDKAGLITNTLREIAALELLANNPRFQRAPEFCVMSDGQGSYMMGVIVDRLEGRDLLEATNHTLQSFGTALVGAHTTPHPTKPMDEMVQKLLTTLESSLEILQTLKDHQLVHNDLKPENLMVNQHGTLTAIDFPTTRRQGDPTPKGGTKGYEDSSYLCDPNNHMADYTNDMFAMGITLTTVIDTIKVGLGDALTVLHHTPQKTATLYQQLRRVTGPQPLNNMSFAQLQMLSMQSHGALLYQPFNSEAEADAAIAAQNLPGNSPPSTPIPTDDPVILSTGLCNSAHLQLIQDLEAITAKMRHILPQYRYSPEQAATAVQLAKARYTNSTTVTAQP